MVRRTWAPPHRPCGMCCVSRRFRTNVEPAHIVICGSCHLACPACQKLRQLLSVARDASQLPPLPVRFRRLGADWTTGARCSCRKATRPRPTWATPSPLCALIAHIAARPYQPSNSTSALPSFVRSAIPPEPRLPFAALCAPHHAPTDCRDHLPPPTSCLSLLSPLLSRGSAPFRQPRWPSPPVSWP